MSRRRPERGPGTPRSGAILVGLSLPDREGEPVDSLDELALLLGSLGIETLGSVVQRRESPDPACLIGRGKAEEVRLFCLSRSARYVVVDERLSPVQKSTLEKLTGATVWDRPFVIMKIFERRAVTAEARLQVELALTRYEIPHLKGLGLQMSRTGAGIGTRGPGETEFERHRRRLERRVREISRKLENVRRQRRLVRDRRKKRGIPTVSLVGYTNSGKSTLLKALSGDASILAEDRLFSTLDTSVRRIVLPGGGAVLFSDTVGFIRNLPPALVAAFRATLEEIREAELLLLLLDASAPEAMSTYEVIVDTLTEIECRELPRLLVLNKLDAIPPEEAESLALALRAKGEDVLGISALQGTGLRGLLMSVERELSSRSEWFTRPASFDALRFPGS
ncbi:GTPase HflX [uncultured Fretibacterium sp.]|uniref:GTPase HflX n=1 Tax=uncultured Fretibacterium sp. TaxID=1678694 RepID=UPI00260D5EA7|nr:GTPase HflX [uncultured Fretibacterium sp.]